MLLHIIIHHSLFYKILVWKMIELKHIDDRLLNYIIKHNNCFGVKSCLLINKLLVLNILRCYIADIIYHKGGKPLIINTANNIYKYISISHKYNILSIGLSITPIGIDIEKLKSIKILKIIYKFIRDDEIIFLSKKYIIKQLYIIWSIKESLYKIYNSKYKSFFCFKVFSFIPDNNQGYVKCAVIKQKICYILLATYKIINNKYILVYVL